MTRRTIEVYNMTQVRVPTRRLQRLAGLVMQRLKVRQYALSIIFVTDTRMRRLNRQWRGKNTTTDVLSFQYQEDPLEGEVYVSSVEARKQAREYRHSFDTEIEQLVIHGLLHLVGHDHEKTRDAERMRRMEQKIWREFHKSMKAQKQ